MVEGIGTLDVTLDATTKFAESIHERLEYELLAAWRMGYDFLYVGTKNETMHWGDDPKRFTVTTYVHPSNNPEFHPPPEVGGWDRYDLRELTREKVQEVRNQTES